MMKFKPNRLVLALLSTGVMAISFPTMAAKAIEKKQVKQESNEEKQTATDSNLNATTNNEESGDRIVVTGFRQSLKKSQAMKDNSSSIIEAISAEDIGKLPDVSIAESLARLPGVAAQRLDGRANVISIRGLGPEFNMTTFNGREQVTIGDSRGIEFDQYPSEMINEVVVYKTPDASLATTQGLGGTVDLRTISPLTHGRRSMKVNARLEQNDLGNLNPDGDDQGNRLSFSFIDQFNDGKLGVAFGLSHMDSPNQEERWQAWGYPDDGNGNLVLGGAKPYVRSSELKRDGFMSVIEYVPNEHFAITFDAYYSDFEDKQILRGIEIPVWWGSGWSNDSVTVNSIEDGLVTSGQINNAFLQIRNDINIRDAELQAYGLKNVFTLDDNWEAVVDLSYSKADRADWGLESYAGTGRGNFVGIGDTIGFTMNGTRGANFDPTLDYADPNIMMLGGNLSWGNGVTVPNDGQDGFINNPWVNDELTSLRLTAERALDGELFNQMQMGINLSSRDKFRRDSGKFLTLTDYPNMVQVPSQYLLSPTSLNFLGMGNMLSYDALGLYNAGYYNEVSENATVAGRSISSWDITEKSTTAFFKLDLDGELFTLPVRGNLGVQIVQTDQSSVGNGVRPQLDSNGDSTGYLELVKRSGGDKYTEVLPSINLVFTVADNQRLRFGLARTQQRAQMFQMNAGLGFGFNPALENSTDINNSPWSGSGGNPQLRPWLMDQLDISYEHYFDEGYFAAALYHKHLENWVNPSAQTLADFSDISIPGYSPTLTQGYINVPQNGSGGHIQGAELTLSTPFNLFSESLDGFGSILSFSYTDSEVRETKDADPIEILGLSRKVANATLFYENAGWQFRTSARYRSDFLGNVTGLSLSRQEVKVKGETLIDAQVSYDFSEGRFTSLENLSVFFQVTNLNDEAFVSYNNGDERQIRDHQVYGRNFMLGLSYDF